METVSIGAQGDRVEVTAVVTQEKVYDTVWGVQHHVRMATPDGALVFWRASRDLGIRMGDTVTVRATVRYRRLIEGDSYVEISNGRLMEDELALF